MSWVIQKQYEEMKRDHKDHEVWQSEQGRSIHQYGLMGGSGEVRTVSHLYCKTCEQKAPEITLGTPIQEGELIRVGPR